MGSAVSKSRPTNQQKSQNEVKETRNFKVDDLYGDYETQVSEGGEADLHKHLINCKKNPGHTKFIPVDKFTLNHLPKGRRDKDLYEFIKITADMTVKVDVKMTSPQRPEFWPNTKVPYPFYNMRGKTDLRTGSGTVIFVDAFIDGIDKYGLEHEKSYSKCWCKKCQQSNTASHMWWEMNVYTANQVVFDEMESSQTSVRFFYDREDSPEFIIDQVGLDYSDITKEVRSLKCVTCEKYLPDKLGTLYTHFVDARYKVSDKCIQSLNVDKFSFIVSHPHGCYKQIYFDIYKTIITKSEDVKARMPGDVGHRSKELCVDHEIQVSVGGEADLHKHLVNCKKNPGHTNFIPSHTFTLNHLPEGHRDNDLYELIKVTADLTVRVAVKIISPKRPKFWPNTKVSYPFYNMRGKANARNGSGMVSYKVFKYKDGYRDVYGGKHDKKYTQCWCKKCQHSDTASHVWWEFFVTTAAHVVFDEIEASHTSLRLFYDREECPLVSVDEARIEMVDFQCEWCILNCATCDPKLGERLKLLCEKFNDLFKNVRNKYKESRDVDKLNFLVSHPHGCPKQVSVGRWTDKIQVKENLYRFTYMTCTCPGSSGARVHCVGYGDSGLMFQLVHSGCLESKVNYSGVVSDHGVNW